MILTIYPYRKFSQGARLLGRLLGAKLRYKPKRGPVLNWGNGREIGFPMFNQPLAVNVASNKLHTFEQLGGISTVPWTTSKEIANGWLKEGSRVVVRTLLRASEGRGIAIIEPGAILPNAQLYTKYVPKKKEFRVHVVGNAVIDIQEKRRKQGTENNLVRSHDNNYVFCREDVVEPKDLRELATKAVFELGLDFGGVDIIWNEKQDKSYLLEVNTAPGLTQTTAEFYAKAFKGIFK